MKWNENLRFFQRNGKIIFGWVFQILRGMVFNKERKVFLRYSF